MVKTTLARHEIAIGNPHHNPMPRGASRDADVIRDDAVAQCHIGLNHYIVP